MEFTSRGRTRSLPRGGLVTLRFLFVLLIVAAMLPIDCRTVLACVMLIFSHLWRHQCDTDKAGLSSPDRMKWWRAWKRAQLTK